MIELIDIVKRYGGANEPAAVDGVSLRVERGELLTLLGESGSGKTTTLKTMNRLIEPTSGSVRVDGRDVSAVDAPELRRGIGYVFQGVGLLPHRTVAENLEVVPELLGWSRDRRQRRNAELMELVNLDEALLGRWPHELSGGQQQRVGVARALAAVPASGGVMLMDEPFGAIDPLNRDALREEFRALHDRLGLTTVLVTHDVSEALLLGDRVGVMRNGRLLACASPGALLRGEVDEPYVSALVGSVRERAAALAQRAKPNGGEA